MNIPFATQSYRSDSLPLSAQRAVNLYAEMQPQGAKVPVAVFGAPGITTFATCGNGPVRGMHVMDGVLYVVSGGFLYSVSDAATPVVTLLGGQIDGSGLVSNDDNGAQLEIVNGTNGYIYSASGGFLRITDANFQPANTVTFIDQFFLFDRAGTNQIARSALLDGSDFSENSFASAETRPDNVLSVYNLKQLLYVMGERSIELHANAGLANFPFQRVPNGSINRGVIAPRAFAEADEALFVLGDDRMAYRISGAQLERKSTHAIERAWQKYTATADAFAVSYTWNGHKFVVFTFPTQAVSADQSNSWAYDVSTGLWHERESLDINGTPLGRWCGNCVVDAYDKVIVGDAYSGQIGYLDDSVTTEFGRPMYVTATGPVLHNDRRRHFMREFELDMETGVGITSGQGSDPQVMLDMSDDGGRTWTNQQRWQSLGAIGAYGTRLRWFRLGNFFQRVMRITISDPVRRVILAAHADITPGMG